MSLRFRVFPEERRLAGALSTPLLMWGLLALPTFLVGCAGAPAEEEEHAAHEVPAHRPRDFPSAVGQIRSRWDALSTPGAVNPAERRNELGDILRWLPEIAGESELGPREWNEVQATSDELTAIYERQSGETGSSSPAAPRREELLEALDRIALHSGHSIYGRSAETPLSSEAAAPTPPGPHS